MQSMTNNELLNRTIELLQWLFTTTEGLTLLIACVTAWAAFESRRMVKATYNQFQASNRPLLGMSGVKADPITGFSIIFENYGRVITKHRIKKMLVDGKEVIPREHGAEEFITFPGQNNFIFLGSTAKNGSVVEFQVEYEDATIGDPKYLTGQIFHINGNTTLIMKNHAT
jgi:hypothetical protein